jgi:hypothetical protein
LARANCYDRSSRPSRRKGARIVFKGHEALIDCTVSNLSDRGARLKVESPIGIPDTFDLVLDNAPVRSCRVTWRKATQIGVEFAWRLSRLSHCPRAPAAPGAKIGLNIAYTFWLGFLPSLLPPAPGLVRIAQRGQIRGFAFLY